MGSTRRALALLLVSLASSLAGVRGAFEIRAAAPCEMSCCDSSAPAACCVGDEASPSLASGCGCCGQDGGSQHLLLCGLDWSPADCERVTNAQPRQRVSKRSESLPASRVPSPEAPPPRA